MTPFDPSAFAGPARATRLRIILLVLVLPISAAFAAPFEGNYWTMFNTNENPISESGAWSNIDATRSSIATSGGRAFGTQAGGAYDDSVAWLDGTWPPDVQLTATVFRGSSSGIEELELLLRGTQAASTTTGYEVNYAHDGQYVNLYRWEGGIQLADFVPIVAENTHSIPDGLHTGDRIRVRIQGDTVTAFYEKGAGWVTIFSGSDISVGGHAKYPSGRPGIGAFKTSGSGALDQFAFEDLTVEADGIFADGFEEH
ncbi:MAG: hypothetical protein ABIR10_14220 [Dokdonella sp.]